MNLKQTFFKVCKSCGFSLPSSFFYKFRDNSLQPTCKHCVSERAKKIRRQNPAKIRPSAIAHRPKLTVHMKKSEPVMHIKVPAGVCNHCLIKKGNSVHHIIPRSAGGSNDKTNLIHLCSECHDLIEMKTDAWIESGKYYDSDLLRSLIMSDGF